VHFHNSLTKASAQATARWFGGVMREEKVSLLFCTKTDTIICGFS